MNNSDKPISSIHTDKYTPWKGKLQPRNKNLINLIIENWRHNIHNKWIIALLVIAWIFSVFFPLLMASFGTFQLMQDPNESPFGDDPENAFEILQDYDISFPLTKNIQKNEIAEYNITVMNTGARPDTIRIYLKEVQEEWNAYFINQENETTGELYQSLSPNDLKTFQLIVQPPQDFDSGIGEVIVGAESKGAFVDFGWKDKDKSFVTNEIKTFTVVGHSVYSPYHFIMNTRSPMKTVKAQEKVEFIVEIENTGQNEDIYFINVEGLPEDWNYTLEGLESYKNGDGIYLNKNESKEFKVIFDIPKYPFKENFIGVLATSQSDPSLSGGVVCAIEVTDIPKKDMTSEIMTDGDQGLFSTLLLLFTLFLTAIVGSKAISNDLAQKSYTIYFARPLKKLDYILIKYGSVASTLALVTLVPVLISYAGLILLSNVGFDYFVDHLWVWGAIILYSLLIIIVFTSISLAFSSFTSRRFYAAFGLVVVYFMSAIMGEIIVDEFDKKWGTVISINDSLQNHVAIKIFNVSYVSHYSWYYYLSTLLIISILATIAVILKIKKMELSE